MSGGDYHIGRGDSRLRFDAVSCPVSHVAAKKYRVVGHQQQRRSPSERNKAELSRSSWTPVLNRSTNG